VQQRTERGVRRTQAVEQASGLWRERLLEDELGRLQVEDARLQRLASKAVVKVVVDDVARRQLNGLRAQTSTASDRVQRQRTRQVNVACVGTTRLKWTFS
jgi:hypothetical protein